MPSPARPRLSSTGPECQLLPSHLTSRAAPSPRPPHSPACGERVLLDFDKTAWHIGTLGRDALGPGEGSQHRSPGNMSLGPGFPGRLMRLGKAQDSGRSRDSRSEGGSLQPQPRQADPLRGQTFIAKALLCPPGGLPSSPPSPCATCHGIDCWSELPSQAGGRCGAGAEGLWGDSRKERNRAAACIQTTCGRKGPVEGCSAVSPGMGRAVPAALGCLFTHLTSVSTWVPREMHSDLAWPEHPL